MPASAHTPKKVGMISLGCAKNLVDAEIMLGGVLGQGMQVTNNADEADVLIVGAYRTGAGTGRLVSISQVGVPEPAALWLGCLVPDLLVP